jgi:hypothetical protein
MVQLALIHMMNLSAITIITVVIVTWSSIVSLLPISASSGNIVVIVFDDKEEKRIKLTICF